MTRKEHIIFFSISSVVVILVLALLYIGKHVGSSGEKPLVEHLTHSLDDETRKEKNLMISDITAIIIAFTALIGTPITIMYGIPSYREKMRKNRIDKLKDRMLVLFSEGWNHQRIHTPELEKKFFEELGLKFQKKRYSKLHEIAYEELGREGKNDAWIHKNLKRQAIKEKMKENLKSAMPGPGGIIHR